jgi:hypothetical protein
MAEFKRHTGLATCVCTECVLIRCGAVDADWDGFRWAWLAGEGRVALMLLTRQPPVGSVGPRGRWAGVLDWFDRAGVGLVFDECPDEEGDDESA